MHKLVITPDTIRALFSRGGSGTGCSYYVTAKFCPMKAELERIHPDVQRQHHNMFDLDVGTLFHFLAGELYHCGEFERRDVVFPVPADVVGFEDVVAEAWRLFQGYRQRFPIDAWGTPYEVEWGLHEEGPDAVEAIEAATVSPFTLRIDMVTDVSPLQAQQIQSRGGQEVAPGRWLLDFKTKSQKRTSAYDEALHRIQFKAYIMAYNAVAKLRGWPLANGMLVVNAIRHKTLVAGSFPLYVVPTPDEYEEEVVQTALHNGKVIGSTGAPLGVLDGCVSYGKICQFHPIHSGICPRK